MSPRVPVAFRRTGIRFLGILSRRGVPPLLRSAYRAEQPGPDGVSTFHAHETRPGWAPPLPRGQRCPHDQLFFPVAACRHFQRPGPITRVFIPSSRACSDEASSGVHSRSPVWPSPRPVAPPDRTGALGLLPQAPHPTRAGPAGARQGGD
jgi:hypothetical protein